MNFSKEQLQRYRGHISLCEIDFTGQMAISRGRVLIIGAGGLGSPVALYLAAAGVGHIGLVDSDTVSLSNLQRQIIHSTNDLNRPKVESARESMLAINPEIEVETYPLFFTESNASDLISGYDLVVDCTDNFTTRRLINDTCVRLEKPFVFGAVSRFSGQVFTHRPGTADFRTFFGDEIPDNTEPCAITGILNTVVGVIGALQATEAVKLLSGAGDLLTDRLLHFDAITMQFTTLHA